MTDQNIPKVFISYSWSTASDLSIELAKRLMRNGVDVVIDKWNLLEGQNKYEFMQKSVNDETIDKVILLCDKSYSEKANEFKDGVGQETMIISPQIYKDVLQTKFLPIVIEKDDQNNPYLPSYLKPLIYIDLSP
ncbi:MAG: toll/interleukin-1 receptor domain-containing protein, partial [Deltaproteobacteria bacterium]|nr:toll/interleukin-1 receptor domain-containing protein [Deltaproteobacteria bacterium]